MTTTHILGYPRIGNKRELKFALEHYWKGEISQQGLLDVGATIRHQNWQMQKDADLLVTSLVRLSTANQSDFRPYSKTSSQWSSGFGYLVPHCPW
ncbi:5-methyltetrahydropteroyltriglutamate--homocysteine methyltransferase [Grimontia marina]|uniref:5-methyltetrahydropteroyltriglutamate--homocysteine methyltransferase n=1 Tax=Grimontia marina TaxID=646534 RepID=A0A128FER9_9GAMM|nr:5-methyltetrahydropteroyltriglutamate--homocysteine methyltransferase [Grimontia marina]